MKPKTKNSILNKLRDYKNEYRLMLKIREQILNSSISSSRKTSYLFDNTYNLLSVQNQIDKVKANLET